MKTEYGKAQMLLRLARLNCEGGQISGLALEILLSLAEKPQTIEQLTVSCGAANGQINRTVRQFCVWYDRKAGRPVVPAPELCWLQRRRMPRAPGQPGAPKHRYHLTTGGRAFLAAAGFSAPVS